MKSLGRLRDEIDHSCRRVGKGALWVGPSMRLAQGVPGFAPRCSGLLGTVRSRTELEKRQGSRVHERSHERAYG